MSETSCAIVGGDFQTGGAAARCLKERLKKIGANPAVIRRAMIAAYEAEMNVVIHARRGEFRFRLENGQLDVEVIDEGPGIADVAQALQPGFSTASAQARELGFGAGMGLPNIKQSSDEFTLESTVGRGTTVRFRIHLKPQALYGTGRHSLTVQTEKCRDCYQCVRVCPTGAIRLFEGRPLILDYLCIDCTACLAACPRGAFQIVDVAEALTAQPDAALAGGTALLVQFGPLHDPEQVRSELARIGFSDVVVTAPWEASLRRAALERSASDDAPWPVISPACPAVVNLIEMRFPALIPHLAPYESPFAAAAAAMDTKPQTWVVLCPCQRTELTREESGSRREFVLPAALHAALGPRLSGRRPSPEAARGTTPARSRREDEAAILRVTGLAQVIGVLERIEDGQVGDVAVVEPWACAEGCFGSPLLTEAPALARHRWASGAGTGDGAMAPAAARAAPYAPRPGLRLDANMSKAVQKLGRIDRLARQLPGSDCGLCGAPTCRAFAEDVVLGRANEDACVRRGDPPKETP